MIPFALTVRQPWAWAICQGYKLVENRSRRTPYRGPIYIHAALRYEPQDVIACELQLRAFDSMLVLPRMDSLPLQSLVCIVDVLDCAHIDDPWAIPGCWQWRLGNVRAMTPTKVRGRQGGLWRI